MLRLQELAMSRLLKLIRDPQVRFYGAVVMFFLSIILGTYSTIALCHDNFQRVLMAISWGAITITAIDLMATTDVRKEQ